jgi:hypothetical protein
MAKVVWASVRAMDLRIDSVAKSAATAIKDRGGYAAEMFLRRLSVHLDDLEHPDLDDPSRRRRRRREA